MAKGGAISSESPGSNPDQQDTVEFDAVERLARQRIVVELGSHESVWVHLRSTKTLEPLRTQEQVELRIGRTRKTFPSYLEIAIDPQNPDVRFVVRQPDLTVGTFGYKGKVELPAGEEIVIGRETSQEWWDTGLEFGPDVSREHCSITILKAIGTAPDQWLARIEDLGSTNGTEVIADRCDVIEETIPPSQQT